MGATLVKRQSSWCVVGKPSSENVARAADRISLSHGGAAPAPFAANAWNWATYRSIAPVARFT